MVCKIDFHWFLGFFSFMMQTGWKVSPTAALVQYVKQNWRRRRHTVWGMFLLGPKSSRTVSTQESKYFLIFSNFITEIPFMSSNLIPTSELTVRLGFGPSKNIPHTVFEMRIQFMNYFRDLKYMQRMLPDSNFF